MRDQTNFPRDFFTADEATGLGITNHQLRTAVRAGVIRRYLRGVYAPAAWPDDVEHRARAAALVLGPGRVFVDRTAAWLHGVDVFSFAETDSAPCIETAVLTRRRAPRVDGVRGRSRDLLADDVMDLGGVRVTTPLRTSLDVACNVRRGEALGALDALARRHGVRREALLAALVRFRGRRGVVQARQLVLMIDPRAESPRESQLRLAIVDSGLPCPDLQHVVLIDGHEFRLDLAYPARRVAIEYDGEEFHTRDDQHLRDEHRRHLLRQEGWKLIVVRRGDLSGRRLDLWLAEVHDALAGPYSTLRW